MSVRWPSRKRFCEHLDEFTDTETDALIFTGARGGILRRSNIRRAAKWNANLRKIGCLGLHFHDLRHTGNTIADTMNTKIEKSLAPAGGT
ncbi:hypothetical protein ACNF49_17960 [Actinomadura sp. ATCC 39365]